MGRPPITLTDDQVREVETLAALLTSRIGPIEDPKSQRLAAPAHGDRDR